ncbi:hypothetical protein BDA99DRAFT_489217 [Phascolomyces articulosus]|uniref:Uncharacterized protein n=1 Tax=Phascolomyces articulosus TaxID=60185 RepID=A0AAD5K253_9FUNG|nr:hypothetical protein BDA99DRAFT_489217 [Phascolomyces articulosus]
MVRLGKELKIMADKLVRAGVHNPTPIGMIVKETKLQIFKMVLDGPGAYVMVEMCSLNLLRTPADIPLVPVLVERFTQVKRIVEQMVSNLYDASNCENTRNGQLDWLRDTCKTPIIQEPSVPKSKKSKRRKSSK